MGNGKKLKSPFHASSPRLAVPPFETFDTKKPKFSFEDIRYQKPGCISRCNTTDKSIILSTLLRMSQLTWAQINIASRENLGFERLNRNQLSGIPLSVTSDTDLLVFRFSQRGRFAGYRINDVLFIVAVGDLYKH